MLCTAGRGTREPRTDFLLSCWGQEHLPLAGPRRPACAPSPVTSACSQKPSFPVHEAHDPAAAATSHLPALSPGSPSSQPPPKLPQQREGRQGGEALASSVAWSPVSHRSRHTSGGSWWDTGLEAGKPRPAPAFVTRELQARHRLSLGLCPHLQNVDVGRAHLQGSQPTAPSRA